MQCMGSGELGGHGVGQRASWPGRGTDMFDIIQPYDYLVLAGLVLAVASAAWVAWD